MISTQVSLDQRKTENPAIKVWDENWRVDPLAINRVVQQVGRSYPEIKSFGDLALAVTAIRELEGWGQHFAEGPTYLLVVDPAGRQLLPSPKPDRAKLYKDVCFEMHRGYGLHALSQILLVVGQSLMITELALLEPSLIAAARDFIESEKDFYGYPKCPAGAAPSQIMREMEKTLLTGARLWQDFAKLTTSLDGQEAAALLRFFSSDYRAQYTAQTGEESGSELSLAWGDKLIRNLHSVSAFLGTVAAALAEHKCLYRMDNQG